MINIQHQPLKYFHNNYVVKSDSIEELIKEMIPRIRKQSQEFYNEHLSKELKDKGYSVVCRHSGCGNFYHVVLTTSYLQKTEQMQIW